MTANMATKPYAKKEKQNVVKFNYYEVWYGKRKYQILTPKNCSQFCVLRDLSTGSGFYPEVQIITNRKGLEALRNASAALAEEDNVVIYFPCKKNAAPQPLRAIIENYNPVAYECLDLVLMKPNTLKISDWKEIRKRISKMEAKEWGYNFKCDFKDMKIKPKYEYCESVAKQKFGFDTVFYNIPRHECPGLASWMGKFLDEELEEKIRKIIYYPEVGMLDCIYFYCNGGLEVEATFWDEDIYTETGKLEQSLIKNSFETFKKNRENLFAYSCARAAAEAPGETFNPIYIYGKTGCGKSHLLDAAENKVHEGTPQIKIRKMAGVKWNELLGDLLHNNEKSMSIRCELLGLQMLLIDDFDVAAQTEEMQHKSAELLANMREKGGQIVIASQNSFESMDNIESELVVELRRGIIAEIVGEEQKPT